MSEFSPEQISEFEGAFKHHSQGEKVLTKDNLKADMRSLGFKPTDAEVAAMLKEAGGNPAQCSFEEYLTMMSDRLKRMGDADDIAQAFECFDTTGSGTISLNTLRDILQGKFGGDAFTDREVRELAKLGGGGDAIAYNDMISAMLGSH
eukprot:CAMPEP_0174236890 /NCGR_PEP_ID=MMETSP0417-20130205/6311_1 /TAXON_ID=242541 /ORGANISM="Mayorella sp, Strain BSH-02190019" /LENGTH=147 /DNA_ID=CAMNT_0015315591 /DNA_START=65 /DNA_END=508 /DNA_ORIENTATION=+